MPKSVVGCRVVAAHLILRRPGSVLLLRRYETGWEDGNYSVIAGHVDAGESPVSAMLREAREEAGIQIEAEDLQFAHVMHRLKADGEEKLDVWFACDNWQGEPYNAEPGKCDDLRWFVVEALPMNVVEYVRTVLGLIGRGCVFSTYYDQELVYIADPDAHLQQMARDVR